MVYLWYFDDWRRSLRAISLTDRGGMVPEGDTKYGTELMPNGDDDYGSPIAASLMNIILYERGAEAAK